MQNLPACLPACLPAARCHAAMQQARWLVGRSVGLRAWCLVPGAWCLVPGAWCLRAQIEGAGGPNARRVGHGTPHEQFFYFLITRPKALANQK